MSLAQFRRVFGKNGAGRFVVSEGIAPSTYLLTHPGLPTLYTDLEDSRFEIVITKGTILSVVADSNGDSRIVPANGSNAVTSYNDAAAATPIDTLQVNARTVPIGVSQYDLYRPFDKGTSQGAGWIVRAYVEWPMISSLNDTLTVGSLVKSDGQGRPVPLNTDDGNEGSNFPYLQVGKVIEIEKFATNFDDGLLSYMLLPADPGALKTVFELTQSGLYQGKLGIRANLDKTNAVGAFRVSLTL